MLERSFQVQCDLEAEEVRIPHFERQGWNMLVLTRKRNERIDLLVDGQKIAELSVVRISGSRVALGLTAPREVDFQRGELSDSLASRPTSTVPCQVDT